MKQVRLVYHWWPLRHTWIGAITLGHTIFFKRRKEQVSEELLLHELRHVEQIEKHGLVKFYLLYLWYSLRYGYKRNPFEVEARGEKHT